MKGSFSDHPVDAIRLKSRLALWRSSLISAMAFTHSDLDELEDHIRCRTNSLIQEGNASDVALETAISDLGEPEELISQYREKNRRLLSLEAVGLMGWGFMACLSVWEAFLFLYCLGGLSAALATKSIWVTDTVFISIIVVSCISIPVLLVPALRESSYSLKCLRTPRQISILWLPFVTVFAEFFRLDILERIMKFGVWTPMYFHIPAFVMPGFIHTGLRSMLVDLSTLSYRYPLLLDGDTIWQQTTMHNTHYVRNAMALVAICGVFIGLVFSKRNSILSFRRCFFLTGLACAGIGTFLVPRYLGNPGALCLMSIWVVALISVPLLTVRAVKKDRLLAD